MVEIASFRHHYSEVDSEINEFEFVKIGCTEKR